MVNERGPYSWVNWDSGYLRSTGLGGVLLVLRVSKIICNSKSSTVFLLLRNGMWFLISTTANDSMYHS